MKQPILLKHVLPFVQWYALMIAIAIAIDFLLHYFNIVAVGRYLGFAGTVSILLSFIYSLRKRKIIQSGSPKDYLQWHEYASWTGAIMLLVHAGIHFNAWLPWLAIVMLLITVGSGLVGKYLLRKANESLKESRLDLINKGNSPATADKILFYDAVTVDLMKKWRVVHMPITLLLGILSLIHIISIILFSK